MLIKIHVHNSFQTQNEKPFILQVLLGPNADDLAARPHSYRYKLLRPGRRWCGPLEILALLGSL